MEQIDFESWWKEFQFNHEKQNDNGARMLNDLLWTLKGFSDTKRIAFINELIEHNNLVFACRSIPFYGSQRQKNILRFKLISKIIFDRKNHIMHELALAILKTYKPRDYLLLKCYFYVNIEFDSMVMQALYEQDKVFFLSVFKNILRKTPNTYWLNVHVLINNTDSRDFLKSNLTKIEMKKLEEFEIRDIARFS
jgi:hypothetical protein